MLLDQINLFLLAETQKVGVEQTFCWNSALSLSVDCVGFAG